MVKKESVEHSLYQVSLFVLIILCVFGVCVSVN